MNEFETKLLAIEAEQNETLKRLQAAVAEQGETLAGLLTTLQELGKAPNVVRLSRRVQEVEGEVSELRGRVARHEADIERLAAGGSNAG